MVYSASSWRICKCSNTGITAAFLWPHQWQNHFWRPWFSGYPSRRSPVTPCYCFPELCAFWRWHTVQPERKYQPSSKYRSKSLKLSMIVGCQGSRQRLTSGTWACLQTGLVSHLSDYHWGDGFLTLHKPITASWSSFKACQMALQQTLV